jgi:hypothetical protein
MSTSQPVIYQLKLVLQEGLPGPDDLAPVIGLQQQHDRRSAPHRPTDHEVGL